MKLVVFDIEADDLLLKASKVFCVATKELGGTETKLWGPDQLVDAYHYLLTADRIIAHNGITYDVPVLERLIGGPRNLPRLPKCIDTLLLSRFVYPDEKNHPIGGNSLEAWGNYLHFPKGVCTNFTVYTPAMGKYCCRDVDLAEKVYLHLIPKAKAYSDQFRMETEVAELIATQIQTGIGFDIHKAEELIQTLLIETAKIADQVREYIPDTYETKSTPEYWSVQTGEQELRFKTKKEAQEAGFKPAQIKRGPNKVVRISFNPGSRKQIYEYLIDKYEWKPTEFTPTNQPVVNESVLEELEYPEAKLFLRYMMLDKRLGQVQSWIDSCRDGNIWGSVITIGCQTTRMSHSDPNLAQVPNAKAEFGLECRDLFRPPTPFELLVGVDASGLEYRLLASYLAKYDNGETIRILLNEDIHTANQRAAGIDSRDDAKTFIYAYIYGAGLAKIAKILKCSLERAEQIINSFNANMPALEMFKNAIEAEITRKNGIIGLDDRLIPVRSVHAGNNTKLQSAGAIVMKKALLIHHQKNRDLFEQGKYRYVLNVHDEFQMATYPEYVETLGISAVEAIREAGVYYDLACPLDGQYKVGKTWKETH